MFPDMFQAIVERIIQTPDHIALLNDDGTCTFGSLGARCQGIMDALAGSSGVAMVYGHKEVDAVAAMLACALARRPFVFVDIANPVSRIAQIARTVEARVTLCSRPLAGPADGRVVDTRSVSCHPLAIGRVAEADARLFYIAFTSGSTGTPKGVKIGYDNFDSFYRWYGPLLQSCRGVGAHVNHASFSFDMGMLDLWPALALGKPVVLLDHRHNALPRANLRTLTRSTLVVPGTWFSTPTFLAMMCAEASFREATLPQLRSFFLGGEPAPRALLGKLTDRFPGSEIWHGYAPTEVTCLTHCHRLTGADLSGSGAVTLGRALPPNEIRVVAGDGRELAANECGEIELGGPQVAQGYVPEDHPENRLFGRREGQLTYRTGDYGSVDRDGNLTLLGRCDGQLKWNGNRIEIGEIERVALNASGVDQAVVVPVKRGDRVVDLVLVVDLREDDECQRSAFAQHLAAALPGYMRPRTIRFVDQVPVTLHGKVDRMKLTTSFS